MSSSKNILITGGAGFVGSNLAISFKKKYPHYRVLTMDNLKRRGSELNLARLSKAGVEFYHGDVRCPEDFEGLGNVSTLIECSAEPSVSAGIDSDPTALVQHNLMGTVHCLNFARKAKADFIFLSTSRVYPIEKLEALKFSQAPSRFVLKQKSAGAGSQGIREDFPLEGYRSFYGATKLSSEYLIEEYRRFYGLKTVINRCGVIAGPWQMGKVDQGFVALWMARHFWKKSLSYIGYGGHGKQVRDILHVDDLFSLLDIELHSMNKVNGGTFNVGGGAKNSVSLVEFTKICENITGNKIPFSRVAKTRPADIRWYVSDNSKITRLTDWRPKKAPQMIAEDVYAWIKDHSRVLEGILK